MKKDVIFAPILFAVGASLFLFRFTGLTAHIVMSVLGLVALVAYAVLTKKEWKKPAFEVIMRVFYGIALITGIVVMNIQGIAAIGIVHKASAVLFLVLLIILLVIKASENKKQ